MIPRLILSLAVFAALASTAPAQNGGLAWSTYLGGSGDDLITWPQVQMSYDGSVIVAGGTISLDFPMQGAYQPRYAGPSSVTVPGFGDGVVARLDPAATGASQLVWSTYLGGSREDMIIDAVVDPSGAVTVCGVTQSPDFPTTPGAFQTARSGGSDGFVSRLVWDGTQLQLLWSTLLGGNDIDTVTAIALHPSGAVVVAGHTASTDFPMRGQPYQAALAGGHDGFVAVLDPTGSQLRASTYLGGLRDDFSHRPWAGVVHMLLMGADLVLDDAENPVIAGVTNSHDFPCTPNAYQPAYGGGPEDGFVARMDIGLGRLTYASYLGGINLDALWGMGLAPDGDLVVVGVTASANYPVTPNAYDTTFTPGGSCPYSEVVVSRLDTRAAGASQLEWSTFFGGTACENAGSVLVDRGGRVTIGGAVGSTDLPVTTGAYQPTKGGGWDGYVAWFDPARSGAAQLLYCTYLGGSTLDFVTPVAFDGAGGVLVAGNSGSADFPTTPGAFQTGLRGRRNFVLAQLTLLPTGVERYGTSAPACGWPVDPSVDSQPGRGSLGFTLLLTGAPPSAGVLLLGPRSAPVPFLGVDLLVDPVFDPVSVTANAAGCAEHRLAIPASVPPGTQLAAQWVFLTTPTCPGIGPLSSSAGLEITVQ